MDQISIFNFIEDPEAKPVIGKTIFVLDKENKKVPAVVKKHCGGDYLYVESEHSLLYGEKFLNVSMRAKNKTWFIE